MIHQFQIGAFKNFIYLITEDKESFVIDPQDDLAPWENQIAAMGSTLKGVLLTHTHWDHIAGLPLIEKKYPMIPVYVHEQDAHRLKSKNLNLQSIHDGQKIELGKASIQVLHTPGHSAGECCYWIHHGNGSHLFTGDTVFVGDVGRTDLESGSTDEMFKSIQRLKQLPANTIIYPGHYYGKTPTSTLDFEMKNSAAFLCKSVGELDALP